MKLKFTTTLERELIEELKIAAIKQRINVNDILEKLIEMYLKDEIKLKKE